MKTAVALASLLPCLPLSPSALAAEPEKITTPANPADADAMFAAGSVALLAQDYPKAFKLLSDGAEAKHGPSEAALGFMYFNGFACEKDVAKARKLYEQSAAKQAHQGYNNLAHLYRHGLGGLEKDVPKAVELLENAARLGNEFAVNSLAQIYMGTELGAPDTGKILQWLKFGAERNYRGCLSDLGYAYQNGIGVERDLTKAVALYQKSIDLGSAGARSNLGYLHLMGEGVPRDYPRAMKLFQEAADANDLGGIINLAVMHFNGLGCDRNPTAAFALLEKAAGLGSEQAGKLLKDWKAQEAGRK